MEEIVTADAIQGEILEDARKKAERILAEAEEEAERTFSDSEAKAISVVDEIHRTTEERSARFKMETMARFPLESMRMRTVFVDERLRESLGAVMAGLTEGRVASLAETMLAKGASYLEGKPVALKRKGLSESLARDIASRALKGLSLASCVEDEALPAPGLVAEAADGSVALRATMDLVEGWLLDLKRGELARALCADALGAEAIAL